MSTVRLAMHAQRKPSVFTGNHSIQSNQEGSQTFFQRLCCRFRPEVLSTGDDDITSILIFGVTGMVGGAVMEACLLSPWMRVTGFTRAVEGDSFLEFLSEKDIKVVNGDMTNYNSILAALDGIDVIFLNTAYWETMSAETEVTQGMNVVNAAMAKGIRHLIYAGTDYTPLSCDQVCHYLEGKSRIEAYIVNSGIPYTIIPLPFFFENLLGVFKPHLTGEKEFAIAFPMEEFRFNMVSVLDYGSCVAHIALRIKQYVYKTVLLSSDFVRVNDIVLALNELIGLDYKFYDPMISLAEYRKLDFDGAMELATMWQHCRHQIRWTQEHLKKLCPSHFTLRTFIEERKNRLLTVLQDDHFNVTNVAAYQRIETPGLSTNTGLLVPGQQLSRSNTEFSIKSLKLSEKSSMSNTSFSKRSQ